MTIGKEAHLPRPRYSKKKRNIKGRKYTYPTSEEGKRKLFQRAKKYFRELGDGTRVERAKDHNKLQHFYYSSRRIILDRMKKRFHARKNLERAGLVHKFDGTEVDHLDPDTMSSKALVIRKNRCEHRKAWGHRCRNPNYKPKRRK